MIYTELTKKAMKLAYEAHRDQADKGGLPYVFHPFHLAESMPDEISCAVALLHDVAEDTPVTVEEIGKMGFPREVTEALSLLTHDPAVPYPEYVARLRENPVARRVKLADLRHNSDVSRLEPGQVKPERLEKYAAAIALLEEDA